LRLEAKHVDFYRPRARWKIFESVPAVLVGGGDQLLIAYRGSNRGSGDRLLGKADSAGMLSGH
jgi:hypothetical protein